MFLDLKQHKQYLLVQFKKMCNLNSGNTDELKTLILNSYQNGQSVIIDFKNLELIDSAGLTVLIHIRRKLTETKGSLKFCNIGEKINNLLQITRLHRVFDIYDTEEAALKSIKTKSIKKTTSNPYSIRLKTEQTASYILVKIEYPDSLIKSNVEPFRETIRKYIQKKQTVILNFDEIRNIDSAGIACLIHLKRYSREKQKKIFLVYDNRVLNRLFRLYSLDDLFSQFKTDQEAISVVAPVVKKQVQEEYILSAPEAQAEIEVGYSDIKFLTSYNRK